jgi:hypothetical protein
MKLSKPLLQAIAVAVTISAAATSCEKSDDTLPGDKKEKTEKVDGYNCPACGMG